MIYLPLFSNEQELRIINDKMLIDKMHTYMNNKKLKGFVVNKYILESNTPSFINYSISDSSEAIQNAYDLLHFFIAYQYYDLACQIKSQLSCSISKILKTPE